MGAKDERRGVSGALGRISESAERVEALCQRVALIGGSLGLAGLVGCAALALLPPERWPSALEPGHLPVYAVSSLAVASLLGWGIVQQGMVRLRKALGAFGGGLLFVLLPLVCGGLDALSSFEVIALATWPGGEWLAPVARWYTPALVTVTLVAYVTWKARPREPGALGRGLGLALVVTPYAALMLSLTFGVHTPWLEESMRDALGELGGGALAIQLALAFLVAAPG